MPNVGMSIIYKIKQCFHVSSFKFLASDIAGMIQSCNEFEQGG
jgi:hypothetical protein